MPLSILSKTVQRTIFISLIQSRSLSCIDALKMYLNSYQGEKNAILQQVWLLVPFFLVYYVKQTSKCPYKVLGPLFYFFQKILSVQLFSQTCSLMRCEKILNSLFILWLHSFYRIILFRTKTNFILNHSYCNFVTEFYCISCLSAKSCPLSSFTFLFDSKTSCSKIWNFMELAEI